MRSAVIFVVVLILCWIAWPYWAAYDLARAIRDGDTAEVAQAVDWESVRGGLSTDFKALLAETVGGKSGSAGALGSVIAAFAGPTIVDQMVEKVVNPDTLALLVRKRAMDETAAPAPAAAQPAPAAKAPSSGGIDYRAVRYAFFTGPATFEIDVARHPDDEPLGLVFSYEGRWKLSRIDLPLGDLRRIVSEVKSERKRPK